MAIINDTQDCVTVIVTFSCKPEQQDDLSARIRAYIQDFICVQAGFVSSTVHKSTCGEVVVNYAQWQSMEDFKAFAIKAKERPELPLLLEYEPKARFYHVEFSIET